MKKKTEIYTAGGQAVIEGVLMRSLDKLAIAVRKPNGRIKIKKDKFISLTKKKVLGWPFIRGMVSLIEMMVLGIKSLNYSANEALEEDEQITKWESIITIFISLLIVIVFFIGLPYFMTTIVGIKETVNPVFFNLVDGIIKIALFVGYILGISMMKDMNRLFQYHGAEHKTVHCYEAGEKLNLKNIKKYPTLHPRCGSAFIMIVMIVSIIIFSFVPSAVFALAPAVKGMIFWQKKLILFGVRIMLIPVIAGLSYEVLRLSGKYSKTLIMKIVAWPGLMLQKLTTKEPDDKQIEVAMKSLKAVVE